MVRLLSGHLCRLYNHQENVFRPFSKLLFKNKFFFGWRVPAQFSGLHSFGFAVPRLVLLLVKLRFGLDDENFTILKRWKSERGEVGKNLGI